MEAIRVRLLAVVFVAIASVTSCGSDSDASSEDPATSSSSTSPASSSSSAVAEPTATASTSTTLGDGATEDGLFPDIVDAEIITVGDGRYDFNVTVSSPYDTDERYADAWRITNNDGAVFGVRELTHGHPGEQPFTRSLAGVTIPPGITQVTIEGRDILNGWGGETLTVELPAA